MLYRELRNNPVCCSIGRMLSECFYSHHGTIITAAVVLFSITGCNNPIHPVGLKDLEDRDPLVRIRAIKWAGENHVKQAVPLLVDRLCEQDSSVRFFAIESLRKITGTDHGFDYKADAASREAAIQRWRQAINPSTHQAAP